MSLGANERQAAVTLVSPRGDGHVTRVGESREVGHRVESCFDSNVRCSTATRTGSLCTGARVLLRSQGPERAVKQSKVILLRTQKRKA